MPKNRYTNSGHVIVHSLKEMKQKMIALKRIGKPLWIALLAEPNEFNQELPQR
jgi:hypothetical protein